MPSKFGFIERELKLATADLSPERISKELAKFAKQSLAEVIRSGQGSPQYDRYVDGRKGAPEESVRHDGVIRYEFVHWPRVIEIALEELRKRVPRKTGRYAGSFVVLANQKVVVDYTSIPADAEVVIINAQPYTRKMEVGANKTGKKHFDRSELAFNRRFSGAFVARTMFLNVSSGLVPGVPYHLKRSQGRRKDRQAGMPVTYPALVINAV